MLTQEEKDKLMSIAVDNGYWGFSKGKYLFNKRSSTSPATLFTGIGFPKALKVDGLYRVFAEFDDLKGEIANLMSEYAPEGYKNSNDSSIAVEEESSAEQLRMIRNDIALFKTIRFDSSIDPKAKKNGGVSILAFNTKTRTLVNGNFVSIDGILSVKGLDRDSVIDDNAIPHVWPVFNPYTTDLKFKHTDNTLGEDAIVALNTAIPPRWMTHHSEWVKPKFTGFYKKLVEWLFPDEQERERVLDWCHHAIFKRNGTVLCLVGPRGTGKSTFVEILGELVGENYFEIVGEAILQDKFNPQFKNKRLIAFEEVALSDPNSINKIKAWCNNKISIEEKGSNAFSADNFTSMVFLLNNTNDLQILPQERRFSIPVVAQDNFLKVATEEEIDKFKVGLLEERTQEALDALAEFGLWIKQRKPKYSEHTPIKGDYFNMVADSAMAEWQTHLRDFVLKNGVEGEIIPITEIFPIPKSGQKEAFKTPTKRNTIDNFVMDYRYKGKYRIGDLREMTEREIEEHELTTNPSYSRESGSMRSGNNRTRRTYGIVPRKEFLEQRRFIEETKKEPKITKPEDLL